VATYLGTLLGISFAAGLVFALIWLGVAAWSRYSSAAALAATALAPYVLYARDQHQAAVLYLLLTLLLWYMHRENITRLVEGKESRIGETS
jgi:acyl phosphate:glycerol-3-phosphate acyltransferase